MAASPPPPPTAVLRGTTQMSLNERFTTLLKNTGPPRPAGIRPSGWQRLPAARRLRRRARHQDYRPRFREAGRLGLKTQAQRRAPLGSPEGALAGAAIAGARDLLFIHRGDWTLEGARGPSAPRTVLKAGMSPPAQDPLPAGLLASAPQTNFPRRALPARGGPHPRARFGAQAQGPGRGRGRSPLICPPLTKEQLDAELDAYMAAARPTDQEGLDADWQPYMIAQAVPDQQGLDSELDAYMADADADNPMNTDP